MHIFVKNFHTNIVHIFCLQNIVHSFFIEAFVLFINFCPFVILTLFVTKISQLCLTLSNQAQVLLLSSGMGESVLVATLGSILDSQPSWESCKFQLARWSHGVALFSVRDPPSHPPPKFCKTCISAYTDQIYTTL